MPPPSGLGPEKKYSAILVNMTYQTNNKSRTNVKCKIEMIIIFCWPNIYPAK